MPANICADESPEREGLEAANFSSSDDSPVDTAASSAPTEYQSAISLRSFGFDEQIPPVPLVTELHFSSSTESLFLDDVYLAPDQLFKVRLPTNYHKTLLPYRHLTKLLILLA